MTNPKAELTKRELEVLKLIASGLTDESISLQLNITVHTANAHRKKLLAKLNCNNVAMLVAHAMRTGLIE